jgi:hypothetical protein
VAQATGRTVIGIEYVFVTRRPAQIPGPGR